MKEKSVYSQVERLYVSQAESLVELEYWLPSYEYWWTYLKFKNKYHYFH